MIRVYREVAVPQVTSQSQTDFPPAMTASVALGNGGGTLNDMLVAFDPDVTVEVVSGVPVTVNSVTWNSDNQLTISLTSGRTAGTATLRVTNPYGGQYADVIINVLPAGPLVIENGDDVQATWNLSGQAMSLTTVGGGVAGNARRMVYAPNAGAPDSYYTTTGGNWYAYMNGTLELSYRSLGVGSFGGPFTPAASYPKHLIVRIAGGSDPVNQWIEVDVNISALGWDMNGDWHTIRLGFVDGLGSRRTTTFDNVTATASTLPTVAYGSGLDTPQQRDDLWNNVTMLQINVKTDLDPSPNMAAVDVDNVRLVPGTVTVKSTAYPVGWYDKIGVYSAGEIAREGGNIVLVYTDSLAYDPEYMRRYLDEATQTGIKVIVQVNRDTGGSTIANFIRAYDGHPAVYGWYTADEPGVNGISVQSCEWTYTAIKSVSSKPVFIAFGSGEVADRAPVEYQNAYDVMLMDYYPFRAGTPEFTGAAEFKNVVAGAVALAQELGKPYWDTFQTAVTPDSPFAFVVMGDTFTWVADYERPRIFDRAWAERPNFVLHVGDVVPGGRRKELWAREWLLPAGELMARVPLYVAIGNHEEDAHWFYDYVSYPKPENFYSFDYGNAHFAVLDSNKPAQIAPGGRQYQWLDEDLGRSKATWKFVALHHPLYSSDDDDCGDTWKTERSRRGDLQARKLAGLFEKHGVDVVWYGHIHTYERTWPIRGGKVDEKTGVVYIQTGGGGSDLEEPAPVRNWFTAKVLRNWEYCLVTIHGGTFHMRAYDIDGRLFDLLDLDKR